MTDRPTPDRPVAVLDEEECWALLAAEQFGRLGYRLVDEIHVVPVNYGLHDGSLVVRTAAGNKLLAAELESEVGFEIDGFEDDDLAWSVLVRGRLRHLDEQQARIVGESVPSWVPMLLRYDVLEIVPATVTGRRFLIQRG
jgi:nitroimidazol reductase NimA-like FMN-containing flavoprotein (pyridoxamine 5'-phosphate oxidase superfamily)